MQEHYFLSLDPDQYNILKRPRRPNTDCYSGSENNKQKLVLALNCFADTQSKVCIVSGFLLCTSPHHQLCTQFLPRMFE